jgi:hypothetical protein
LDVLRSSLVLADVETGRENERAKVLVSLRVTPVRFSTVEVVSRHRVSTG